MSTVDLHTHTIASDGDFTPTELLAEAKKVGIKILGLTDHDTIDGLEEGEQAAFKQDIEFVPGMEISAKSKNELHILGYYIERDNPDFQKGLAKLIEFRNERESITIDYLHKKGVEITAEEVKDATRGNVIGRPHMAAVMISKGYVKTKKEAFEKYIGTPEYMSIKRPKTTVEESIEIIKSGHGVPVLAHPHSLKQSFSELDLTLKKLKEIGLCGMECYYNSYTKNDIVNYLSLALKHGLLPTGGSDYHGPTTKPDVILGSGKNGMYDYNNLSVLEQLFSLKSR